MEYQKVKKIPSGEEALRLYDSHEKCKSKVKWLIFLLVISSISLIAISIMAVKITKEYEKTVKDSGVRIYQITTDSTRH